MTWPLAARAQEPGRTYRIGFLLPGVRELPATVAFFDEMRLNGFVEGQNLAVIPGGFAVRDEQLAKRLRHWSRPSRIRSSPARNIKCKRF